jgi:hypothetical protein
MLPPMLQISNDDGSGGYHSPCSATAALTSALSSPGCATAVRVTGSDGDVAHLFGGQDDRAVERGCAAGKPGAHTAGHDGDCVGGGPPQRRLYVSSAAWSHHRQRRARVRIERAVLPIGRQDVGIGDDRSVGQLVDQAGQHIRSHGSILRARITGRSQT